MVSAKANDTVRMHYTARNEDGTVLYTSVDKEPLQFTIGQGYVISGLEEAVLGMEPGESKTFKIPPEKGYGPHLDEMVIELDRTNIPTQFEPKEGQVMHIGQSDHRMIQIEISEVTESKLVIDANHPLAGKDLYFEIKLTDIVSEPQQKY